MSKIVIKNCDLDGGPEAQARLALAESLKATAEACRALAVSSAPMINIAPAPDLEPVMELLREMQPKKPVRRKKKSASRK